MRRLPVYPLLDTSDSMLGEPIEAVKNGLQVLCSALRSDPQALETVYLSLISFDQDARQIVPLTDLASFQPPALNASGPTALGGALALLADRLSSEVSRNTPEVSRNTPEQKGDWKPLIFLMTDGVPTDDWRVGLSRLDQRCIGLLLACAAGPGADVNLYETDHRKRRATGYGRSQYDNIVLQMGVG